jgi:hypothetical protein
MRGGGINNYAFLTPDQIKFIATTYPVIVLSGARAGKTSQ